MLLLGRTTPAIPAFSLMIFFCRWPFRSRVAPTWPSMALQVISRLLPSQTRESRSPSRVSQSKSPILSLDDVDVGVSTMFQSTKLDFWRMTLELVRSVGHLALSVPGRRSSSTKLQLLQLFQEPKGNICIRNLGGKLMESIPAFHRLCSVEAVRTDPRSACAARRLLRPSHHTLRMLIEFDNLGKARFRDHRPGKNYPPWRTSSTMRDASREYIIQIFHEQCNNSSMSRAFNETATFCRAARGFSESLARPGCASDPKKSY